MQVKQPVVVGPLAIHQVNLEAFLQAQDGKFVGVDFVKLDGSKRKLNGRLGVKCHLHGGTNTAMRLDRPYLTVYDVKTRGYRNVNLSTLSCIRAEGKVYAVV